MDFVESRERDFEQVFGLLYTSRPESYAPDSFVSRYAVVRGETNIGANVLVAQRAYLENAHLGKGANVQENAYVVDASLEGYDVMVCVPLLFEAGRRTDSLSYGRVYIAPIPTVRLPSKRAGKAERPSQPLQVGPGPGTGTGPFEDASGQMLGLAQLTGQAENVHPGRGQVARKA